MTFPHLRDWRVFGFYGLIISALGSYAWHLHGEKMRRQAHYDSILRTLDQAQSVIERANEGAASAIDQNARQYPCPHNDSLNRQAKFLQKARSEFGEFVHTELQRAFHPGDDPTDVFSNSPTYLRDVLTDPALQDSLAQQRAVLADSLRFSSRKKPELLAAVEANFSEESRAAVAHILANGRDDQKGVLLHCLRLRDAATVGQVLRHLEGQGVNDELPMEGLMPVIDFKPTCVRAGETFSGELFAVGYHFERPGITAMLVNGKPISIENGVGKYRQVFRTPGRKKLLAEIHLKNPATGTTETIKKEFELQVCD